MNDTTALHLTDVREGHATAITKDGQWVGHLARRTFTTKGLRGTGGREEWGGHWYNLQIEDVREVEGWAWSTSRHEHKEWAGPFDTRSEALAALADAIK